MIVTYIGWFVLAMASLGFAFLALCLLVWMFGKAMERFEFAVANKTLTAAGRSLRASAWWFSESPDTCLALRIVSERMMSGLGFDSNQMREEWYKQRQQPTEGS